MNTLVNPYKGIKGGDPRLHPKKVAPTKTVFVCQDCGKKVTEVMLAKHPDTCRSCRTANNLAHQRALEKDANDRSEARLRTARILEQKTPLRSYEELLELIISTISGGAQIHSCDYCNGQYFIHNDSLPFANDNIDRPNYISTVSHRADPFASEINQDETLHWLCKRCYQHSAHEV